MNVIARFSAEAVLLLLFLTGPGWAQGSVPEGRDRNWDFAVWVAGATGEESTNSFAEAQILSGGFFVGKTLTGEIGSGWRRGSLEYGFDVMPLFVHFTPEKIHGGGVEPVILRWNSSLRAGQIAPYIELAGGGVRSNANLPAGDTSNFNFTARGGGGIEISTAKRQSLDIACRWWHISNANLGVRNPEFNGIQVSLGYHWLK
jgi:hypothetical protein